jgi:hypothetical protein
VINFLVASSRGIKKGRNLLIILKSKKRHTGPYQNLAVWRVPYTENPETWVWILGSTLMNAATLTVSVNVFIPQFSHQHRDCMVNFAMLMRWALLKCFLQHNLTTPNDGRGQCCAFTSEMLKNRSGYLLAWSIWHPWFSYDTWGYCETCQQHKLCIWNCSHENKVLLVCWAQANTYSVPVLC